MVDWGRGSYERTAAQIVPVASLVLDAAEPVDGLRLLDLACGTGNAALEAARRGARVIGLDAAPRLLDVAADLADSHGLTADWIRGDVHELPFAANSFEVVTSVFGLIFAEHPDRAAAEAARVLAPAGRLAFSAWLDQGPMTGIEAIFESYAGHAADRTDGTGSVADEPQRLDWGDRHRLRELFSDYGISIRCERHDLSFTAESPEAQNEAWFEHHPLWLDAAERLDEPDRDRLREQCLAELHRVNEDRSGFRITLPYLIALGSPV